MWSHVLEVRLLAPDGLAQRVHEIAIPPGLGWLSLRATYEGTRVLNLFLIDAEGSVRLQYWGLRPGETMLVRGDVGDRAQGFWPGAVPGPLPPGRWTVLVGALPDGQSTPLYRLELAGDAGPAPALDQTETRPHLWTTAPGRHGMLQAYTLYDWQRPLARGSRWYRGDLHMHTLLSDSRLTARQLSDLARGAGLDFGIITEHNALTTAWCDTPLLVIPGVEFTSTRGHWNALGVRFFPVLLHEGGPALQTEEGMEQLLRVHGGQGTVCSLNHPLLPPWQWRWDDTAVDLFETVEILNDPTYPDNDRATQAALDVWDALWARGQRLWGVGGADVHFLPGESHVPGGPPQRVGDPTTCVWAEELSADAILAGIRRGRVYVTRGPRLDPRIEADGRACLPGDEVRADGGGERPPVSVVYRLGIEGAPAGGVLRWLENGREVETAALAGDGRFELRRQWPRGVYRWLRAEVRDADGRLAAFTNPVYASPPDPLPTRWRDVAPAGGPAPADEERETA